MPSPAAASATRSPDAGIGRAAAFHCAHGVDRGERGQHGAAVRSRDGDDREFLGLVDEVAGGVRSRVAELGDERDQEPGIPQRVDDLGLAELARPQAPDRLEQLRVGRTVVVRCRVRLEVPALPRNTGGVAQLVVGQSLATSSASASVNAFA